MEDGEGVARLVEAKHMDVVLVVVDEREELPLYLHEGLSEALELDLAGRGVDWGDLPSLNVQDNPIREHVKLGVLTT